MFKNLICILLLFFSIGCNITYKPVTIPKPFESGGSAPTPPGCEEGRSRGVDC